MIEQSLSDSLLKIFDFKKVSFNEPSDSLEQECLFIKVEKSHSTIKDGLELAKVTGKLKLYCKMDKVPLGYFAKRIQLASPALTKPFFFYDLEENSGYQLDLTERSVSFIYFFSSQYAPPVGIINSLTIEVTE